MLKKAANIAKYTLTTLLAAVFLWFAFRGVDWKAFWEGLQQTRWGWVALYFVAAVLALVFRTERWYALIKPLDPQIRRIPVWDALNVGNLISVVLPGAGELVRCGYVSSRRMSFDKGLGTIMCERVFDVLAVAVILVAALTLKWDTFAPFFAQNIWGPFYARLGGTAIWIVVLLGVLLAGFIAAVILLRRRVRFFGRIAGILKGLATGFASVVRMKNKLPFLLSTVGIWAMYIAMMWCTIRALPQLDALGTVDAVFLSAVGNIASVIPVPGGIGAYHYLVALSVESLYGASWETGILLATLGHEAHAILIILLGVVSYAHLSLRKKK